MKALIIFLSSLLTMPILFAADKLDFSKALSRKTMRPAANILANFKSSEDGKLFKAMMGVDLAFWNVRDLGLCDSEHFDILFKDILDNNNQRILIFEKIVRELLFWNENFRGGVPRAMKRLIKDLFIQDSHNNYKIYINTNFTQRALIILMNYDSCDTILDQSDILELDFWSNKTPKDISEFPPKEKEFFYNKYLIKSPIGCHNCKTDEDLDLLKSSPWCDHVFCSSCWMKYLSMLQTDMPLCCPAPLCQAFLPPSFFIILYNIFYLCDKNYSTNIKYIYDSCRRDQQQVCANILESIIGLIACPFCNKKLIFDIKREKELRFRCICLNEFLVTTGTKPVLVVTGHR